MMDPSQFHAPDAGRVVVGPDGYGAFVPAPLPPRRFTYTPRLVTALSQADAALGELAGVGAQLPDPDLLDAPFKRQEALCSSRIEGAEVTLSAMLLDQVGAADPSVPRDHLREVRACVATLRFGVERLREVPLSLRLVRELHERLLRGDTDTSRTPGEFRTSQNWIGPPGSTIATATYVPPPVPEMHEALLLWEDFVQQRGELPDLLQCAMMHEQFEAIHPFVGGNGRLGRLLVTLFLMERRRLGRPLLYLSAYLEAHRERYYWLLQRVRTHGEWEAWLLFFLEAVRATAERALRQARALTRLQLQNRGALKGTDLVLATELFRTPCITVPEARRILGTSTATARRAVSELEQWGLLDEWDQPRRPKVFLARRVLEAVMHPLEDLRRTGPGVAGEAIKSSPDATAATPRTSDLLMAEARAIVDAARERGILLRLTGGLAVRHHCTDLAFMEREYSDIDFVGSSEQRKELHQLFTELGYAENRQVTQSTDGDQLQYVKRDRLGAEGEASMPSEGPLGAPSVVDHVDIFLDVMRMDHDVDVRGRLDIDEYAISPVDTLIAKLQIGKINEKDVHDAIALLKDVPLGDADGDLSIALPYMAEVCSRDWGLYTDITTNLAIVLSRIGDYGLSRADRDRVRIRLTALKDAIENAGKSVGWRLRARVGRRVAWRREVEDDQGTEVIAPEWDWRRDLG
jgi:Fic family protein